VERSTKTKDGRETSGIHFVTAGRTKSRKKMELVSKHRDSLANLEKK
jgi:hypothetical protein